MDETVGPTEAARRVGVSVKALRVYERAGLVRPARSENGWRRYAPADLARADAVRSLRALGVPLARIAGIDLADAAGVARALRDHRRTLDVRIGELERARATLDRLQAGLGDRAVGAGPSGAADPTAPGRAADACRGRRTGGPPSPALVLSLPWPWAGEMFELPLDRPTVHVVGPLGSGKTRLLRAIADRLPGTTFEGLEARADALRRAGDRLSRDGALHRRIERALRAGPSGGGDASPALRAMAAWLDDARSRPLVVDMIETGLDRDEQLALAVLLRRRPRSAPPLVFTTRSSLILDLSRVGTGTTVVHCPANHDLPWIVVPQAGTWGRESVAACLAGPEARALTEGVVAVRRLPAAPCAPVRPVRRSSRP